MAILTNYFTTKIGQTLHTTITTGCAAPTEVFERRYAAEILAAPDADHVLVHVTSCDYTPAGYRAGDRDQRLGDRTVNISICAGLTDFWRNLVVAADPLFFARYGGSILKRNL